MECCQFKQLHPKWDGRLVSMKMDRRRKESQEERTTTETRQEGKKYERLW